MKCKVHGDLILEQCRISIRKDRKKPREVRECKECSKVRIRLYKRKYKEKIKKLNHKDWTGIDIIKCSFCKTEKNWHEFYNSQLKFKYPKCSVCAKNHNKIMQSKYKYKYYEKKKIYISENREEARIRGRRCLLKVKYKIRLEQYDEMLKNQNYVCKICKNPESSIDKRHNKTRDLSIDHCHKSGKIRGLLCDKCNRGLGYFKDSIESLESAIRYLKSNN